MDRKKLVLLIGALIIAVGTAFAARTMFAGSAAPEAEAAPVGPKVLVAQRALPAGTIITADAMGYQQWPEELVQDAYFIDGESDINQLLGTVVRHPITAGEPVTQGSLVSPGDRGFLAAALSPGMRAVTVPVSARTGVGGFIFPGDRVDLVLTQTIKAAELGKDFQGSETILNNLRVLATDQSTEQATDPQTGKTIVRAFRTVTLEVTPKYAEKVSAAQSMGTLSLVLRSLADNQAELERAIAKGDVVIPDGASPEEEERILEAAKSRPTEGSKSFQTAYNVSRFRTIEDAKIKAQVNAKIQERERLQQSRASSRRSTTTSTRSTAPVNRGPSVRVTRGKATTQVPVNAPSGAQGLPQGAPTGPLIR
ncbi:Flp pilus assembly protein CpaB [uncultured Erythrobacter sp.]|uniref:Flp pilus assembly protein CpaB n=1 Tax=uncultured Erythrobacter sp. TaxID=263913 RepID=UPI00261BBB36|nr:Flp pilus assembly protein CpaB [uncultured Erythrobacter sp.]